jgi:hypothetical protein
MASRIRNESNLAAAMTLLVQTQARFVSDMGEMRKDFAVIRQELEAIKTVLVRHERILEKLPDAIRKKNRFQRRPKPSTSGPSW